MKFNPSIEQIGIRMNELGASRSPFFFMVDFNLEQGCVLTEAEINPSEILYSINGRTNYPDQLTETYPQDIIFKRFPIPFDEYNRQFSMIKKHILRGDSYLVNLTCATPIETNLTLKQIFTQSKAKYKLWIKDTLVVFSPEIFIQTKEDHIYSYPMKGTIDAHINKASEIILNDEKESAEHATIVDLIRNDLSMVAEQVTVEDYRFIDSITTHQGDLLQVSSKISGRLPAGHWQNIGSILLTLLPAGSISGAPKPRTIELIHEAETYKRGFYTGVFGYFDGQNLDSAVMIRFIEQTAEGFIFKSGGGITCQSNVHDEYDEMVRKVYLPF